jgi:hypothetical protein
VLKAGGNGKLSAQAGKGEMEWGGVELHATQTVKREREGRGPNGTWGSMGKCPGMSSGGDQ